MNKTQPTPMLTLTFGPGGPPVGPGLELGGAAPDGQQAFAIIVNP